MRALLKVMTMMVFSPTTDETVRVSIRSRLSDMALQLVRVLALGGREDEVVGRLPPGDPAP